MSILSKPYQERQTIMMNQDKLDRYLDVTGNIMRFAWLGLPYGKRFWTAGMKKAFDLFGSLMDVPLRISSSQAAELSFPPSHPRDDVIYVGHPTKPAIYYPAAEFHYRVFEDKFLEAIRLLRYLGATRIEVEHLSGWSKEFVFNLDATYASEGASIMAGNNQKSKTSLFITETLSGSGKPTLPNDLAWFPTEPSWQQIAEGRLKHGLQTFSLIIQNASDYGVTAKLKWVGKAALGGKYIEHQTTTWRISGTFS
jgi:hypothetical protein